LERSRRLGDHRGIVTSDQVEQALHPPGDLLFTLG